MSAVMRKIARQADRQPSVAGQAQSIRRALVGWYLANGRQFPWRRKNASLYRKIIAEVLLQRTQASTVAAFFDAFIERFPNWRSLAKTPGHVIGAHLKPLGLWKRRGASLPALAKRMTERNGRFPKTRQEIEQLPGVGQYIASAVLLFAHGKSEPLLDVNMARVLERLFGSRTVVDLRYDPHLQSTSRTIVRGKHSQQVNWAVLDLAALVCLPRKPKCNLCPLCRWCPSADEYQR